MDSKSDKIVLTIANFHTDPSYFPFVEEFQILLGYQFTFKIRFEGRLVFEADDFPVVEFATQLLDWFSLNRKKFEDFAYSSMEADLEQFFWMKWHENAWDFGCDFAPFPTLVTFLDYELESCVGRFVSELLQELPPNVARLISER